MKRKVIMTALIVVSFASVLDSVLHWVRGRHGHATRQRVEVVSYSFKS